MGKHSFIVAKCSLTHVEIFKRLSRRIVNIFILSTMFWDNPRRQQQMGKNMFCPQKYGFV